MKITFDDVLIVPKFSEVASRKDVDLSTDLNGLKLSLPVISSNMDTVTESAMCKALHKAGGIGCFHRFDLKDKELPFSIPFISSFGSGEWGRYIVEEHYSMGQRYFCLDVAHGAQDQVARQTAWFKQYYSDAWLMVGNFASPLSVGSFLNKMSPDLRPNAIKVGIGPGSACTTRIKTGVGYPQLSAINDIAEVGYNVSIIADGGMKTPGDIAKALACGADAVMLGGMLAGTDETPGFIHPNIGLTPYDSKYVPEDNIKITYRGSASKESYEDQNKDWATAEGESFKVRYKGPVGSVLADIEGGLKSSFSYVGARNLSQFKERTEFIIVSNNSVKEGTAHGKR